MDKKIIVTGRIPSKKNSKMAIPVGKLYKRCALISSGAYTQWHRQKSAQLPKIQLPPIIELTILFYFPDARKTDLTNKAESIMDLLVDNGILADDNWNVVPRLILVGGGIDRSSPRAEVTWQEEKNSTT